MTSAQAHYNLHGVRITADASDQSLLNVIDAILGAYAGAANGTNHLRISLHSNRRCPKADLKLRELWSGSLPGGTRMNCRRNLTRQQMEIPGQVLADVDLAGGAARFIVSPTCMPGLLETCFLPVLCDCLGRAGHHVIHAASLINQTGGQRRALIISGMSGRGKTTLALALAGAGLPLLADDVTFYRPAKANRPGRIWGIRTRCKVHSQTLELLPWLRDLPADGASVNGERLLDSRSLKPPTTGMTASPCVILFLNPRNTKTHRIEPLDKLTALTRLTRENVRAFDHRRESVAGRAFGALAELVRSSRTFQASLCPRLEELPGQLASLWL